MLDYPEKDATFAKWSSDLIAFKFCDWEVIGSGIFYGIGQVKLYRKKDVNCIDYAGPCKYFPINSTIYSLNKKLTTFYFKYSLF